MLNGRLPFLKSAKPVPNVELQVPRLDHDLYEVVNVVVFDDVEAYDLESVLGSHLRINHFRN